LVVLALKPLPEGLPSLKSWMDNLGIWPSRGSLQASKLENGGSTNTWLHIEVYVEGKQSREGTKSIGSSKKNLNGFASKSIYVDCFM